jgi:hypothetical protein
MPRIHWKGVLGCSLFASVKKKARVNFLFFFSESLLQQKHGTHANSAASRDACATSGMCVLLGGVRQCVPAADSFWVFSSARACLLEQARQGRIRVNFHVQCTWRCAGNQKGRRCRRALGKLHHRPLGRLSRKILSVWTHLQQPHGADAPPPLIPRARKRQRPLPEAGQQNFLWRWERHSRTWPVGCH